MKRRSILKAGIALAACAGFSPLPSSAQGKYPDRPIRMIIPFSPGGGTDTLGRRFANQLGNVLGQQIVVDNKAGADGIIGTSEAARARPDGYTLVLGTVSTHSINPVTMDNLSYDPVKSFIPISILGTTAIAIAVHPSGPKTLQELIALVRASPGKYAYGSAGIGSINHLSGELFKIKEGGLDIVHVPYKGSGQSVQDLLANQIPIALLTFSSGVTLHRAGKIRILAVFSEKRSQAAPDVPTAIESGAQGVLSYTYNVLCAPAGTPAAIVDQIYQATSKVMRDAEFRKVLLSETIEPIADSNPTTAAQFIQEERVKWEGVFKSLGIGKLKG
jgi:tripartite-type tricarboxylate transporter receptor subunit TctC